MLTTVQAGIDMLVAFKGVSALSASELIRDLLQKGAPAKEAAALVAEGLAQWNSPPLSSFC